MDDDEILQLVEDGTIEPDDISDFREMDETIQQLVADEVLDIDDAKGL